MKQNTAKKTSTETKCKENIYPIETPNNIKDFLLPIVEFFGILIPGMFFLTALVPSTIIPFIVLFKTVTIHISSITGIEHENVIAIVKDYDELIKNTLIVSRDGINKIYIFLFLIFSYIVRHVLFRQDIKVADFASFQKTSKRYKEVGPVRMRDGEDEKSYKEAAKFPYRDLGVYLHCRGLEHLEKMIPWHNEKLCKKEDERNRRTRHYINNLKIHIEFIFPRQYIKIQKNEAHVRLMSSMWHALTIIIILSLTIFFFGYLILLMSIFRVFPHREIFYEFILLPYFLFPPFSILLISYPLRRGIEKFLHHQRVREIIYILEIAYFADMLRPDMHILGDNRVMKNKKTGTDDINISYNADQEEKSQINQNVNVWSC